MTKSGGEIAQGKAKDAGGLTPAKDDNAALRDCYSRTFAGNSDDCYRTVKTGRDNMNILVLNGSPQPNGNTKGMIEAFREGAVSAGHQVDVMDVCRMNISGCLACEYCHTKGDRKSVV